MWTVPASDKMRREHLIPLSDQAIAIFEDIAKFSGKGWLVFPSIRNIERPLSENAMNSALRRMGYEKDEHTSHGFRSSASSILNERVIPRKLTRAALTTRPNALRS